MSLLLRAGTTDVGAGTATRDAAGRPPTQH